MPPLQLAEELITATQAELPKLPAQRMAQYRQAGLSAYEARVLAEDKEVGDWFDAAAALHPTPKTITNWVLNDLFRLLNEFKLTLAELKISPALLVELIGLVEKQTISSGTAKDVLAEMVKTGQTAPTIVSAKGLAQISDTDYIRQVIEQVLRQSPNEMTAYQQGKVQLRGLFVGQIMRQSKAKAILAVVNQLLDQRLSESATWNL